MIERFFWKIMDSMGARAFWTIYVILFILATYWIFR